MKKLLAVLGLVLISGCSNPCNPADEAKIIKQVNHEEARLYLKHQDDPRYSGCSRCHGEPNEDE